MSLNLSRCLARAQGATRVGRQPIRLASSSSPTAPPPAPPKRPPHRPKKAKAAQPSPLSQLAVPTSPSPSPSIASLLLPVGFHKSPFDLSALEGANRPAGQAIALTTAESFDTPSLLKGLHALGLLEGKAPAVNLLGESIYLPRWRPDKNSPYGEVFIFESGSICTWGLGKDATETFLKTVIRGGVEGHTLEWVERGRYKEHEMEVLEFFVNPNGYVTFSPVYVEDQKLIIPGRNFSETKMAGDAIHLASAPSTTLSSLSTSPVSPDLLARLAFSSGMVRVTKLGVHEEAFEDYAKGVAGIPQLLETGSETPVNKADIIKRVGTLHGFRQKLNLEDENLLDEPEFLWEDAKLHEYHESILRSLEFEPRLEILNKRVDYAFSLQSTLMEILNTLIAFEISIVLYREATAHDEEAAPAKV
ncbi:hypothetical protein RQP46_006486 [Phenoliferia psychrophenolica]